VLLVRRGNTLLALNFSEETRSVTSPFGGSWQPLLDTSATIDGDTITLPPSSFALWTGTPAA
jgi:hypothetical protein